jgi:hypothetical protein
LLIVAVMGAYQTQPIAGCDNARYMAAVAKSKVKSKMGSSESVDGRMARRNSLRFAKTDHAPRILNQISIYLEYLSHPGARAQRVAGSDEACSSAGT